MMGTSGRFSKKEAYEIAQRCKENIDKAVALYLATDPALGKKSEEAKLLKATEAILLCHSDVGFFTQWAESHMIGYYQAHSKNPKAKRDCHSYESFWSTPIF